MTSSSTADTVAVRMRPSEDRFEADLALVLPAFNEEQRLPPALEELNAFAREAGLVLQVVVADDGSNDGTPEIIDTWSAKQLPSMRVQRVSIKHRGKGAAVRAGMEHANAPIVGYCDVDLSAGPDAIGTVYSRVKDGVDMAMGSRALPESVLEIRQPWYRERAGRFFNLILRKLARIPYRDTQCGLKMFRRRAAEEIFRNQRIDGFAFDAELVVLAHRLGYSVEDVAIRWKHAEGSKLSLARDSLRMARDMVRIVRRLGRVDVHPPGVPTAQAIDTMAGAEERHWWYVTKRRLIVDHLRPRTPARRCLDVGCGGGGMLRQVEQHWPVFGVDLSRRALSHAQARGLRGLAQAEAGTLPFRDESFGVALALDVLEHHAQPELLLEEIKRVLEPSGRLLVTVPAYQWMWSYADHVLGHYRRYTRVALERDLRTAGFSVERITYVHSWLLPIAWVFRKIKSASGRTHTADDFSLPPSLNRFFLGISSAELAILGRRNLPFGLTVFAVARRP
jgi:dolichyl-phosphate beta-glucosyltransferase